MNKDLVFSFKKYQNNLTYQSDTTLSQFDGAEVKEITNAEGDKTLCVYDKTLVYPVYYTVLENWCNTK